MEVDPDPGPNILGILLWNTCNARCAHCMPDSGPKDRTRLSEEQVFRLIDGAARAFDGPWVLALSGGEPFLHRDRLARIIARGAERGASVSVVTNGFWAISDERAREVLKEMADAGLTAMSVSVSSYHFEYVQPERVVRAVRAGRALGLQVTVKAVVSRSSSLRNVFGKLRELEPWNGELAIQQVDLLPAGRASDRDTIPQPGLPQGPCPASLLTFLPDGRAAPCCNGAGETGGLDLGSADDDFADVRANYLGNPIVRRLRSEGPIALLDDLPEAEAEDLRVRPFVNACHLCEEVLRRLKRSEASDPDTGCPGRRAAAMAG